MRSHINWAVIMQKNKKVIYKTKKYIKINTTTKKRSKKWKN